ncbi:hypothetical protein [Pseudomonas citronellolis]|jgi:hypothetical protein|uniref:hypothetical protein n=1 Tax=Pseudomonas citronellolis TaxID=53408 RepID=UPI00389B224D
MVLRATGHLSGAVTAEKGANVSHLPARTLNKLIARGLVFDDGKDNPPVASPAPRKRARKE